VKNRRFTMRFVTKRRMNTVAYKNRSGIWKNTINQQFLFSVHSIFQFLSGSQLTGALQIRVFSHERADGLVLQKP